MKGFRVMRGSAIAASLALSILALSAAPVFAQTRSQAGATAAGSRPSLLRLSRLLQPARAGTATARTAAGTVPAGREGRLHQPAAHLPAVGGRQSRHRARAGAGAEEADRGSDQGEAAPGQPDEAAVERQRHERGGAACSSRRKSSGSRKTASASSRTPRPRSTRSSRKSTTSFGKKLQPIIEQIATEKGLHFVFNAADAGFAWVAPGLDISADVIKKLDAGKPAATTPK